MSEEFRSFIEPWRCGHCTYRLSGVRELIDYIEINYSDEEVNFYHHTDNYDGTGILFVAWVEDGIVKSEVFPWIM